MRTDRWRARGRKGMRVDKCNGRDRWARAGGRLTLFLLWSLIVAPAWGQETSVGVKLGGRINRMLESLAPPGSPPSGYTVGPTVEFRLWRALSLDAAALYRPRSYSDFSRHPGRLSGPTVEREFTLEGRALELSFGLRASLDRAGPFSAFGGAGVAFRHTAVDSREVITTVPNAFFPELSTTVTFNSSNDWGTGLLIGGGGRIRAGRVHFVPEVRVTRWFDRHPTFDRDEKTSWRCGPPTRPGRRRKSGVRKHLA